MTQWHEDKTLDQDAFPDTKPFERRPRGHTRTGNDTRVDPVQIRRQFTKPCLIENNVVGQHAIFVRSEPRSRRFLTCKILRVNDRRHPIADAEHQGLLAFVHDLAGCIVARYPKG